MKQTNTQMPFYTIRVLAERGDGRSFVFTSKVEANTQLSAEAMALRDVLVKYCAEPLEIVSVVRHPWVERH